MSISTLESPASRRALSQAAADADAVAEERAARKSYLLKHLITALKAGNAAAPATFTKPWPRNVTPTIAQVICDEFDSGDMYGSVVQLLMDASNGKDVQAAAQFLLTTVAARWADREADPV